MNKRVILARIDELMEEKGITAYKLKENADVSSTIYQWKKNAARDSNRTPSLKSIEKICAYFDVSLSYFFAMDKAAQRSVKRENLYKAIDNLDDRKIKLIEMLVKEIKD